MRKSIAYGSLIVSALSAVATVRADVISFTGADTTYAVPASGFYDIKAIGGSGGSTGSPGFTLTSGGSAADIEDTFELTANEVLSIGVGGGNPVAFATGGGGGGTYVAAPGNTPLLVAGGGGGAGIGGNGGSANPTAAAGAGGGGGGGGGFGNGGGGGGGFSGNGTTGATSASAPGGGGGASFPNGGAGGAGANNGAGTTGNNDGSFGGGGGAGQDGGGGGGGGYTGGNGGNGDSASGGSAGTSFDASSTRLVLPNHSGNGSVTITPAVAVPFIATGSFDSGATLTGTLGIDTVTGKILSAELLVSSPDNFTFDTILTQFDNGNGDYIVELDTGGNAGDTIQLNFHGLDTLAGFTGDSNVTGAAEEGTNFDVFGTGAVQPVPEPAAFSLLILTPLATRRRRR